MIDRVFGYYVLIFFWGLYKITMIPVSTIVLDLARAAYRKQYKKILSQRK